MFGQQKRMSGIKGWERSVPIKRPDNLCASTFTQKPFIPSYEKHYCKPDMTLMVTMEYRRMWFEEREVWQVDAYPKRKKDSVTKTYEQKWREKLKDRGKKKGKESTGSTDSNSKNKLKKYRHTVSKTDSGRGFVGCLSKGDLPCQAKGTGTPLNGSSPVGGASPSSQASSPVQGSLSSQEEVKLEAERMENWNGLSSQNQSKGNSPAPGSLTSHGDGDKVEQRSPELSATQQPKGHELVPQCPRCRTFHAQRTRCPANVLCKDKAFKDRIMNNTC